MVEGGRGEQDRNCQGGKLSFRAVVGVRTWRREFSAATNFDSTYSEPPQHKANIHVFEIFIFSYAVHINYFIKAPRNYQTNSRHQSLIVWNRIGFEIC